MNQQTEQLFSGIAYSYGEYINAYLELLSNSLFFSTSYLDEETFKIQEELKHYFLELPTLLIPQSSEKETCIARLLTMRESLEVKYRSLIAYQRELTLLLSLRQNDSKFIEHYLETVGLNEVNLDDVDLNQIAADCTQFIFKETTGKQKQQRASSLLPYIPIRITKDNYLSYVSKSIRHIAITNQPSSADYLISILEQLFDGKCYEGYGKHFVDLKDSLHQIFTIADTEELFEEANLLNETIENCIDMIEKMFRMICTFSNLLVFDALDFNELTEMQASFFDLYHSIKNVLLNSDDAALILSTLPERMESIQKELLDSYQKASKHVSPDSLFSLLQTYLNMNMNQIFGFSTAKHSAYSEEVLAKFDSFINHLKEMLIKLPNLERKYRMQYFMSQIPFIMSEQTFDTYIHQSFSHLSNFKSNLLAASQLTSILEEHHFFPEPENTPVIEHHDEEEDFLS